MKIPYHWKDTPWGRLAVIARRVVEREHENINEGRTEKTRTSYPLIPDIADFDRAFEAYMRRELLLARLLQEGRASDSPQTIKQLRTELASVENHIKQNPI